MEPSNTIVKSSSNLGIVETKKEIISWISNTRSSSQVSLKAVQNYKRKLADKCGAEVVFDSDYPAWEYKKDSELRNLYIKCYEELFHKKIKTDVIHAGLECGVLSEKFPGVDAISIGPDIWNVHSVLECFSKQSFENVWCTLKKVLETV